MSNGNKYLFFDVCQNTKYIDKLGEEQFTKSFFTVRLFGNQIEKYEGTLKKGNWVHIIGTLRNYSNKDSLKKYYISVYNMREMKPKTKFDDLEEIFDYDWLNDPNFDIEIS